MHYASTTMCNVVNNAEFVYTMCVFVENEYTASSRIPTLRTNVLLTVQHYVPNIHNYYYLMTAYLGSEPS